MSAALRQLFVLRPAPAHCAHWTRLLGATGRGIEYRSADAEPVGPGRLPHSTTAAARFPTAARPVYARHADLAGASRARIQAVTRARAAGSR